MGPSSDDLHFATATNVVKLYRAGEVSPVEHMPLMFALAEKLADTVNPLADRYFSEALERAAKPGNKFQSGVTQIDANVRV